MSPRRSDPAGHRRGHRAATNRARRLSLYRLLDRAGAPGRPSAPPKCWSPGRTAPEQAGRELSAIAADWGVGVTEAVERLQPAGAIYWTMDEPDVQRVLSFPHTMIGFDGFAARFPPHPRLWGTFPRVLGHYCRELGLFGLEEAVRRMTGLPAARFGIRPRRSCRRRLRGHRRFRSGDGHRPRDVREADEPAAGIEHVFVNGRPVWTEGKVSGERPGRALRRQQMQAEAA